MELRQLVPEAEALLGTSGGGSVEELAREARSRLVTVRQQVPGNILHASVSRKTLWSGIVGGEACRAKIGQFFLHFALCSARTRVRSGV